MPPEVPVPFPPWPSSLLGSPTLLTPLWLLGLLAWRRNPWVLSAHSEGTPRCYKLLSWRPDSAPSYLWSGKELPSPHVLALLKELRDFPKMLSAGSLGTRGEVEGMRNSQRQQIPLASPESVWPPQCLAHWWLDSGRFLYFSFAVVVPDFDCRETQKWSTTCTYPGTVLFQGPVGTMSTPLLFPPASFTTRRANAFST